MAVLLCRQRAETPFRHDQLNIRLWSEQELCFVIFHYPLLCRNGFLTEALFSWIEQGLRMPELARRLREGMKTGESGPNLLLMILQDCNYFDAAEIRSFGQRMAELSRVPEYELLTREGRLLFQAERLSQSYERFSLAVRELDQEIRKCTEELQMDRLLQQKAGLYCDMAVICLRLFDEAKAKELLTASEMTYQNRRAERMRYILCGEGEIPEADKEIYEGEKEDALQMARTSDAYVKLQGLFQKDPVRLFQEASEIVKNWKNTYRGML